jgi:hypothetical protein
MCETICDVDRPMTSARPAEAVVAFAPEVWGAALRCITGSKAHTSDCAKSSRNSPPHPHGPSRYEAFLALALVELQNEVLQLRLKGWQPVVLNGAQPSVGGGQFNFHLSQGRASHGMLSGSPQGSHVSRGGWRNGSIRRRGGGGGKSREFAPSFVGVTHPHCVAPGDRNLSLAGDIARRKAESRATAQRTGPATPMCSVGRGAGPRCTCLLCHEQEPSLLAA